jgi:carbon-monoxide dehydrogenase large subunit
MAFVRSPHAHASLLRIDAQAAKDMTGVVAVLTAADLGEHTMPQINPLLTLLRAQDFPLLANTTLNYVGQPVAVVVANTRQTAQAAAAQVVLRCQVLPARTDWADTHEPTTHTQHRHGQLPTSSAHLVHAQLTSPRVTAMAMEPRACSAQWHVNSASLTIWLGSQTPSRARADMARVLGLPHSQVRLISPDVGGAFGAKASVSPEDLLVALTAQHLRATVRWTATRSEDFAAGMQGRGSQMQGSLSLDAQGRFTGLSAQLHFTLGAWLPFSAVVPLRNAARILPGPYRVAALDVQGQATQAHAAPVNIYRGAGRPEAALLMETLVEQAARQAGIDPVALRLNNLISPEHMPYTTPSGEVLDSSDYAALLRQACEKFDYTAERQQQTERRARGEWVGIGLALYVEPCGQGFESARVTLHGDGRVTVASGAPAQGQGHVTTFAQISAEALGCDASLVTVLMGDTDHCPDGTGALASRSTAIGGSAIVQACRTARALREGGTAYPIVVDDTFTSDEAWSCGCVIARMAIDPDTGHPTVERLVWADDAGHIVNPTLAHGQLVGGAAQGLGQAMLERLVYDAQGQLITGSLMDYAVPRADDMPAIEITSLHTPSPNNLLGAKGVGEAGCIGVPAALMNAARDALSPLGERALNFPLTSEQLWRAMQDHFEEDL